MFKVYVKGMISASICIDYINLHFDFKGATNNDGYWTIRFAPLTSKIV